MKGSSAVEPTYKITLTIERSDQPGRKLRAVFKDVPQNVAESPHYPHYSAIDCFRALSMEETRPDPREG